MKQRVAIMVGCLCGGGMERVAAQLSVMLSNIGFEVYMHLIKEMYMNIKERLLLFPMPFLMNQKE